MTRQPVVALRARYVVAVLVVLYSLVSGRAAEAGSVSIGVQSPSAGFGVSLIAATFSNSTCSGAPDSSISHFIVGGGGAGFPLFEGESALLTAPLSPANGGAGGQTSFVGWSSGAPHLLQGNKTAICVPGFPGVDGRTYLAVYEPPPVPVPPVPPVACASPSFAEVAGSPLLGFSVVDLTVADADGDGRLDLVTTQGFGSPELGEGVEIRFGNGHGGFSPPLRLTTPNPFPGNSMNPAFPKVVDLNHDGRMDVMVTFWNVGHVGVWLGQPGGGWGPGANHPMFAFGTFTSGGLAIGDLNDDGHLDMVTGNTANGAAVLVRLGNGAGGFGGITGIDMSNADPPVTPQQVEVADFTGDGDADVLVLNVRSGMFVLPGNGAGGLGAPIHTSVADAVALEVADVNGDSRLDVVVGRSPTFLTGFARVFLGNGDGTFTGGATMTIAGGIWDLRLGDINGDGHLDLAGTTFNNNGVLVFAGDGAGDFTAAGDVSSLAGNTTGVGIGDFDRDGRADLGVVANFDRAHVFLGGCPTNDPPSIAPVTITRQAGSIGVPGQIATVSDATTPAGDIVVSVSSVDPTLDINDVTNIGGFVVAEVRALCDAAGVRPFTLIATDAQGASTSLTQVVRVLVNSPPTIGSYGSLTVYAGEGGALQPSGAPTDNGLATQASASAPGFSGTFTVDPSTGAVTVSNAGPVGVHTVTVTVLDNCGLPAQATFTLHVRGRATLSIGDLSQIYTGTPKAVSVQTDPAGLAGVLVSYVQGASVIAAPLDAGSYSVQVRLVHPQYDTDPIEGTLVIARATPTLAAVGGAFVYDGQPHPAAASATGVQGEALGPIAIAYNGQASAPVGAGSYAVIASFAGSGNYNSALAMTTILIGPATPIVAWTPPAPIPFGTRLGTLQLRATANVPGTFIYDPAAGVVLPPGVAILTAHFSPANSNYRTVTISVSIEVRSTRQVKEALLAQLRVVRAGVTHARSAQRLDEAIAKVEASLEPALWVDGISLHPLEGWRVFVREKLAAARIEQVMLEGRSGVPAATLRSLIHGFADVDRQLAATAIAAATDPVRIAWANQALVWGDQLLAAGYRPAAFLSYGVAWKIAVGCPDFSENDDR